MGVFDGNGYSILNLYINRDNQNQGLFGNSRGLIQKFGLVNNNITGGPFTGGIAAVNYFIIQNVYTTGNVYSSRAGGIVNHNDGMIKNAYNTGYVNGGGIGAAMYGDKAILENVYNVGRTGTVTSATTFIESAIIARQINTFDPVYRLKNAYYLDDSIKTGTAIRHSEYEEDNTTVFAFENVNMLSLEEFGQQESFKGFDFTNDWEILENGDYKYPVLKNVPHIEKEENTIDFAGGNGTYYNPYLITNATQLNNIRKDMNACYKLINNIDLKHDTQNEDGLFYNDGKGWNPIGDKTEYFRGILDGNNYRILNMEISNQDLKYVGLFGSTKGAVITNLKLTCSKIVDNSLKSIAGNLTGFARHSIIYNVSCSGYVSANIVGGIVGDSECILIKNCYNSATINGYNTSGGIANAIEGLEIVDSYNTGNIKSIDNYIVGGIIGKSGGAKSVYTKCTNVYNIGKIDCNAKYAGNIIGRYSLYEEITGCKMKKYYRPPQGKYSKEQLTWAMEAGYKTVFWSLAYVDWEIDKQPSKEEAMEKLSERVHPGSIVLLHSTSSTNGEILGEIIEKWKEMGYSFGTLEEL